MPISEAERNQLIAKLQQFEEQDVKLSEEDFQDAVRDILNTDLITEGELAARLKVSQPTVNRWTRLTAPHPIGRNAVITELIAILQESDVARA